MSLYKVCNKPTYVENIILCRKSSEELFEAMKLKSYVEVECEI
jgi:hypothetical protein